jgi:hypothetical protein
MESSHDLPRRPRILATILGRLAIAFLLAVGVTGALAWAEIIKVPGHLNPFSPLRIDDQMGFLTRMKLGRLENDAPQCLSVLDASRLVHRVLPDRPVTDGCGIVNGIEVERSGIAFNRSFTATCPLAAAWAMFEFHILEPAAREHFGQTVSRMTQLGTYACRNINHSTGGRRSEHARANAIDIAAFVLADGRQVSVKDDWAGPDQRKAAFLRTVRDGACGFFDVVLSPDYNRAHRDHFHFDRGSYRACR